jgi:formylglycine-generating enzyme required for sulfatase activity
VFIAIIVSLLAAPSGALAAQRLAVLTPSASWTAVCADPARRQEERGQDRCTLLEALADEARAGVLAAVKGAGHVVMTRENTAQLLKEMGTSPARVEGECEVETARLIGADWVVSGNVVLVEGTWFVTLKLHEVKTAKLLEASERIEGATQVALIKAVRPAAEALVRSGLALTGASAVAPLAPPIRPGAKFDAGVAGAMVRLPGGTYTMGATMTTVTVKPFLLDVTPVTVAAYEACVGAGKCGATVTGIQCNFRRPERADHPINCMDWNEASAFCAAAGKRLPTEEEREWAARGADKGTTYPWGNEEPGAQLCWNGNGSDIGKGNRKSTCAVGSHPLGDSPHGVKDLAGNVWEWTSSVYDPAKRVVRGGAWVNDAAQLFAARTRSGGQPEGHNPYRGFRCARTAP